jgi:hypothetical protein
VWSARSKGGSATSHSTVRVFMWPKPLALGSGASRPVPTASHFASLAVAMRWSTSGAMRRSSGTTTTFARIAPQ